MRNNPRVLLRRPLAAALLLATVAAMPLWLWLGAHALEHHGHAGEHAAGLAMALVHGHEHEDGVPDHEHRLLPAPSLRPDPPRELQTAALASLEMPGAERLTLSGLLPGSSRTALSGPSPPRLHLLCTLLI
ncbi:MAG: hypothetical protein ACLGI9_10655 [Thermoanaerobaculia bacterium]